MTDGLNREIAELLGWTQVQEYSPQVWKEALRDVLKERQG